MTAPTNTVKHTPGPWRAAKAAHGVIDIFDSRDRDIVTIFGGGVEAESKEANARLIAAAPDLLEALKALLADCEEYSRINNLHNRDGTPATNHSMHMACAAISKATGSPAPQEKGGE